MIDAGFSNFGNIPYGYITTGSIRYELNNKEIDYACRPLPYLPPPMNGPLDRSPILMLDRGNCTFVTKTRNAQNAGARIALIVDNREEKMDDLMMADDGTGSDIFIPALLIKKSDGKIIKDYLEEKADIKENVEIVLYVEFSIVNRILII